MFESIFCWKESQDLDDLFNVIVLKKCIQAGLFQKNVNHIDVISIWY